MDALGTNAFIGIAENDHIGVPKDPAEYLDAITTGLKGDIAPIDVKILRPGVYQDAAQNLQGLRSAAGDIKMPFNPTGGIRLLKHLLGSATPTDHNVAQVDSIIGTTDGTGTTLSVHVNSTVFSWVIASTPDMDAEYADILGLINAGTEPVTASYITPGDHSDGINITADVAGVPFTCTITTDAHIGTIARSAVTANTTGAIKHRFIGLDTLASEAGLTILVSKDIEAFHYFGMLVNTLTLSFEQGNSVQATYAFVGKDSSTGIGTAGISTGQNAISFPVTLVASTSNQIKLAIDGGTAVEVTIPAAAYTTGALLAAAINTAIAGTATLLDSSRNPEVACHVGSDNKLTFYTADKKSTASVAWTAGTNDAGTLLGRGTVVEAAGANVLATPTFTMVLPFIFTQGIVEIDGVEIECEKLTLTINNGLIKKNVLGRDSYVGANKGTRIVSGSFGKWFSETVIYEKFRANADATIKLELRTGVTAAGADNYDCDIFMNKVRYGNPEPTVAGNDPIKQDVPFTSYYADATYKDIAIDVTNLEPSY